MKAKLLKKLRKQYQFKWVKNPEGKIALLVLNHKEKSSNFYRDTKQFLLSWVYDNQGVMSGLAYQKVLLKRERIINYRKSLSL